MAHIHKFIRASGDDAVPDYYACEICEITVDEDGATEYVDDLEMQFTKDNPQILDDDLYDAFQDWYDETLEAQSLEQQEAIQENMEEARGTGN